MIKIPLLTSEDIEVKIKQVTKTGAIALLYKTARVDYRILDEVFGTYGWQVEYNEIKGNLYCTISLWDKENKQWVKKTNCGIESREDGEGNEKKGEASDAAKRAGVVVGIGAELYTAPFIFLEVNTEEKNGKWYLKDPYAKYVVTRIEYNQETRVITALTISNEKTGTAVFTWEMPKTGAKAKKMTKTVKEEVPVEEQPAPAPTPKKEVTKKEAPKKEQPVEETAPVSAEPRMPHKELVSRIGQIAKKMAAAGKLQEYVAVVEKITGDPAFKCSKTTDAQYDIVLAIYKALVDLGYDN